MIQIQRFRLASLPPTASRGLVEKSRQDIVREHSLRQGSANGLQMRSISRLSSPLLDFLAPSLASSTLSSRACLVPARRTASTSSLQPKSSSGQRAAREDAPSGSGHSRGAGDVGVEASAGQESVGTQADETHIAGIRVSRRSRQPRLEQRPFLQEPHVKLSSSKRKGLHVRPPPDSIDPLRVLSLLRQTAVMAAVPNTSSSPQERKSHAATSVRQHNDAVRNVVEGGSTRKREYEPAFVHGWLPLRRAGSAGRIKLEDSLRVLDAVIVEMESVESRVHWREAKDMLLYLAGESGMPGLDKWCWSDLSRGVEGANRVVELYQAVYRGDHITMRLDKRNGPDRAFPRTESSLREQETPHRLFAAYVVALAVLHPADKRFSVELIHLLNPRHPPLRRFVAHPSFVSQLGTSLAASSEGTTARAAAWLRQVSLAQLWAKRGGNGLEIARNVNTSLRKAEVSTAWALWLSLCEGFDPAGPVPWIQSGWEASAGIHPIDGTVAVDVGVLPAEFSDESSKAAASETEEVDSASPPITTTAPRTTVSPERVRYIPPPLPLLTEAVVAPFLAGFARSRLFDHANEIWTWLGTCSPPLVPGVVLWSALVAGYASRGDTAAAEAAFGEMVTAGIVPDERSWMNLAQAYFMAKEPDAAMAVVDRMFADPSMKARNGKGNEQELYGRIISGLLANRRPEDAQAVLATMQELKIAPTIFIVNLFLKSHTYGAKPDFPGILDTLRLIEEGQLEPDVFTFTMILQALLTVDRKAATSKLLRIMETTNVRPSVTTYGTIIASLSRTAEPASLIAGVELLDEMERSGLATNEIIYTSLLQGFLRAIPANPIAADDDSVHPYYLAATTLQERMKKQGISMNRVGYNALIASALALQTPAGTKLALAKFDELQARHGKTTDADGTGKASTPADTWYILLEGFVNMDDFGKARAVLAAMDRSGFEARSKALRSMVDLVRRGGRL